MSYLRVTVGNGMTGIRTTKEMFERLVPGQNYRLKVTISYGEFSKEYAN